MFINIVHPGAWDQLNDKVKEALGLSAKLRVRSFQGLPQAVYEICQGTAQFMSHKKAVGFILGQTPLFAGLMPYYYKETYEVQTKSAEDLSDVTEWVHNLKKDTNFVIFSEDHPVTGRKYSFADELDRQLNEKRIFSFRISHTQHFYEPNEVRPYSVRICSFDSASTVAVLGERFRSPSVLSHLQSWDEQGFLQSVSQARAERTPQQALIESFEEEIKPLASPYFANKDRVWDRSVCIFPDVSADAVAHALSKKLGLSSTEAWRQLATTNMCHWSALDLFSDWWSPAPSLDQLRGLLIISPILLQTKDFAKLLISSYEEVKAQQSWDI